MRREGETERRVEDGQRHGDLDVGVMATPAAGPVRGNTPAPGWVLGGGCCPRCPPHPPPGDGCRDWVGEHDGPQSPLLLVCDGSHRHPRPHPHLLPHHPTAAAASAAAARRADGWEAGTATTVAELQLGEARWASRGRGPQVMEMIGVGDDDGGVDGVAAGHGHGSGAVGQADRFCSNPLHRNSKSR